MSSVPAFVLLLTRRLRDQGITVGLEQLLDLQRALQAGIGWDEAQWRVVCTSLFATDEQEEKIVTALLTELMPHSHLVGLPVESEPIVVEELETRAPQLSRAGSSLENSPAAPPASPVVQPLPPTREMVLDSLEDPGHVPFLPPREKDVFFLTPHFPVEPRVARQVGRALRFPLRSTTRREVDIEATISAICQSGLATPPVETWARVRLPRLILLEDRGGSMAPFHPFCDALGEQLAPALHAYFYDVPALPLFADRSHEQPLDGLCSFGGAPIAILSDAGAARGGRDPRRVAETEAALAALGSRLVVWFNPVPRARWERTTAAQIARLVPMFPLDNEGLCSGLARLRRER